MATNNISLIFIGDMYVDTERGSESVTWDIPSFRDLNSTDLVIRNKDGLVPGQPLQPGAYDVAYVAYDTAGNTAICDFKIYVRLTSACPPLDPPKFGFQECEKWGPGGRFLQCTVGCDAGYRFSQVRFTLFFNRDTRRTRLAADTFF